MANAGLIRTPRIFSTGTILYGAAGLGYHVEVNSYDDALFTMQRMKQQGAFSVKSYNQPRRDQRQQVLKAARELDMLVVPEGGSTFMHNMTMIVDGHTGIEHNIPVRNAYDDVLQLWESTQVGYTPTHVVSYGGLSGENYWYDTTDVWENEHLTRFYPERSINARSRRRERAPLEEYNHISAAKICKDLVDRGVYVNCGAHGQLAGLAYHWEMWMMAQGGMTSHDALRTGTIFPARHLGLDQEIGSLEVGKLADLNVFDASPLADIQNIETIAYVCVNGRIFDAMTLDQVGGHPDTVGSDAFGDGPDSLHIGDWWGISSTDADAHTRCSCSAH
jgi:imidazolonepropionase-like amidohydrolase